VAWVQVSLCEIEENLEVGSTSWGLVMMHVRGSKDT